MKQKTGGAKSASGFFKKKCCPVRYVDLLSNKTGYEVLLFIDSSRSNNALSLIVDCSDWNYLVLGVAS